MTCEILQVSVIGTTPFATVELAPINGHGPSLGPLCDHVVTQVALRVESGRRAYQVYPLAFEGEENKRIANSRDGSPDPPRSPRIGTRRRRRRRRRGGRRSSGACPLPRQRMLRLLGKPRSPSFSISSCLQFQFSPIVFLVLFDPVGVSAQIPPRKSAASYRFALRFPFDNSCID
ncbi:hypothetical protein BHE74_00018274 [Ensete ventricosum]|uniref:Uncharacterized protein n=1 Tax=Ensete ventricosum TaxID=4639 RepID=A0A426ZYK0_ENSVE|nr:hypothetical protein B296_00017100 [Ensete ventricosum]RWW73813.1 hypothetical protein BHE74_00018274 [Ensete ventricosum]